MRWFRELFNPALKCERVGHVQIDREERWFRYPPTSRFMSGYVASETVEVTPVCRRCGAVLGETKEVYARHLTSLTMDRPRMERLHREGRVAR